MGKKNKGNSMFGNKPGMIHPRKVPLQDRALFCNSLRSHNCLYYPSYKLLEIKKINPQKIKTILAFDCKSIEHQIIKLRELTQLSQEDYERRLAFTQNFLSCLRDHHDVIYEGILFGSSVNGIGFSDSDIDLRLRPLAQIGPGLYEPYSLDEDMVERTLRNIAYQTTECSMAIGEFVPSKRIPVAKLTFVREPDSPLQSKLAKPSIPKWNQLQECLKYDITLGSETTLGAFNSMFLRFLCNLQPKFHLLATVLRYWSNVHKLIQPGRLSSYALINMLIFFCQTLRTPLLPTINEMRDLFFKKYKHPKLNRLNLSSNNNKYDIGINLDHHDFNVEDIFPDALTKIEWDCIVCLDKSFYQPSQNQEPLSVLLLKFFEFYLKFPYNTDIITTRPGKSLSYDEFKRSSQFHPRFTINRILSIQDPFDAKHNLTAGIVAPHFRLMIRTIKRSYEIMHQKLTSEFLQPRFKFGETQPFVNLDYDNMTQKEQSTAHLEADVRDWGLNCLFTTQC